ncbi:MAG: LacI family DNA-binding transcriptional regulator, partial [Planctomycetes bacterium]|nr:LacI family DNA-binding transcriptional regulator [Planctomycetota bacterium]
PDRPTAVIGYSAWSTCPFWHAALRLGLRVPADLSLLTFENWRHDALGQELTQYLVPEAEMGQAAVSRLLTLLAAPGVAQPPSVLPFTWVPGETVAGVNG